MFRIENKHIYINRGDKATINLVNNTDIFRIGEFILFTICKNGDYTNVISQKRVDIDVNSDTVVIELTSEDTTIGEPLKNTSTDYWYEISLNGDTTLVGYDKNGPKIITLWPEAPAEEV